MATYIIRSKDSLTIRPKHSKKLIFNFEPGAKDRQVHFFERMFTFDARAFAGQTILFRFRIKGENPFEHSTFPDSKLSLFFFDNAPETGKLKASTAFAKPFFYFGRTIKDICLSIDIPKNAKDVTIYCYTDRNVSYSWELSEIDILTATNRLKITDVNADSYATAHNAPLDLTKHWRQEDNRIIVKWLGREFYADFPDGFKLEKVPQKFLRVAEELLFGNLEAIAFGRARALLSPDLIQHIGFGRDDSFRTKKTLLSFSTGEDSTAALCILPDDTISFFSYRPYHSYSNRRGATCHLGSDINEMKALERVKGVVKVANTFELIGISVGTTHGYRDGFGYAAIGVLLCSYFDANVLAFGSVMEQVYLKSGNNFTDIVGFKFSSMNRYNALLGSLGIFWCFPTGYLSEILTNKICRLNKDKYTAVPCPKTDENGEPCGTCFKCFRKLRLEGIEAPLPSKALSDILKKRPLKSAISVVYAAQKDNYTGGEFEEYMDTNLVFLERYFGYGFDCLLPKDIQEKVKSKLDHFGIERMTNVDEVKVRHLAKIFDPENYSEARAYPDAPQDS